MKKHNEGSKIQMQHPLLKQHIRYIYTVQSDNTLKDSQHFKFFADGSPGILFYQSEQAMFLNRNEKKLATLFLYGQTVKPIEISASGSFRMIIVYLYPHVVKSLFGIEAREITDTCVDFDLLPFTGVKEVGERLSENISLENQIQLLSDFLLKLINRHEVSLENDLQYVISHLVDAKGNVPLRALHYELQVSERTFERKFLRHVGVSPRLFARICRFQSALTQLRSNDYLKLTDVAYENGFADQSHFIRTFKEFTGLTPREYQLNYQIVSEDF